MGAWDIRNIQTIYGCSVGSVFAVILSLKPFFSWEELDAYLIRRPWHQVFTFDFQTMIQSIQSCGLFTVKCIEQLLGPLFRAVDISLNITMLEMYEKTGIEQHFFVTRISGHSAISQFELLDISHLTHPDWKVIDAVYCSASLPIVFVPHTIDRHYYIDGGFMCNYPIDPCIQRCGHPDEIFGLSNTIVDNDCATPPESPSLVKSLFDFILMLLNSMWFMITLKPSKVKCQYNCSMVLHMGDIYRAATSEEYRTELINTGSSQIHALEALHPFMHSFTVNSSENASTARIDTYYLESNADLALGITDT